MRAPWTIWRYVTREVLQYSLLGLAAMAIVMLTRSLADVLDELMLADFALGDLAVLVRLIAISLLVYALPIAFLFGVLLAIGRMAADVEIIAMRACGFGVASLMVPIGALGLALSLLTLPLCLEIEPMARRELTGTLQSLLVRGAAIEPGRFNRLGDRTFYVDERGPDGSLRGIVISDRSDAQRPFTVFAESGELEMDEASGVLALRLGRGDVHLELTDDESRYQRVSFESLEYRIDLASEMGANRQLRPSELPLGELRALSARIEAGEDPGELRKGPANYPVQLQQRYALPAAPLLFAMLGLPLGMQRKRGARSWGVILCAGLAFTYYATFSFSELLVVERGFPPRITTWAPNAIAALAGAVLLRRAGRAR